MNDNTSVQEIMILLKRKYNHLDKIFVYTQDMLKSLSQNDLGSVEMLLDMRYTVMLEVEKCNELIDIFINQLSDNMRLRVKCQMSESSISSEVSFEENKINEIYLMTRSLLHKTLESDKIMNSQLAAGSRLAAIDAV